MISDNQNIPVIYIYIYKNPETSAVDSMAAVSSSSQADKHTVCWPVIS